MKEIIIQDEQGRLDKVLAQIDATLSRSQIKKLLDEEAILVNGEVKKAKYAVKPGDQITIAEVAAVDTTLYPEKMDLDIVYEDDDVLVVNKPQGMVVHPAPGNYQHTLVNGLLAHTTLPTINAKTRPGIVHRIDKDTSGLLMVAKTDQAYEALTAQLKDKTNLREYVALVHGRMANDSGMINQPLGRNPKDRKKQAIVKDGRPAVTHYQVLKKYQNYTLIQCQLETGRTHQIRVHLKSIGHPLAGDPLYGPRKTLKANGQFLHAKTLGFKHPRTGEQLMFTSELPEIFTNTIKKLDNNPHLS